jgi:murein endopeptidase
MRRALLIPIALLALALAASAVQAVSGGAPPQPSSPSAGTWPALATCDAAARPGPGLDPLVAWRESRAVGKPWDGRLRRGVRLPCEGEDFFTWDSVLRRAPNRGWRRWGTDRLVRTVLSVAELYRQAHPEAPRMAVSDLSRKRGGNFDEHYGGLGHQSHQNGLDVDVYYPRLDLKERGPLRVRQIDRVLSQELVDLFVEAGAQYVFVGPHTGLAGPSGIVQRLRHHDDHMHVRIRPPKRARD